MSEYRPPSPAFAPKLDSVSTSDLGSISAHVYRTIIPDASFIEVGDEQAHLQVMRGRLDALRSILTQLSSVLNSVNETHMYIAGQVHDLEMYVAGLAQSADARTGQGDSAAAIEMKTAQKRGQNKGKFWNILHLNR